LYSAAYRFLDTLQVLPVALTSITLPLISRAIGAGNKATTDKLISLSLIASLAAAVPVVVTANVTASKLLGVLFGDRFESGARLLEILAPTFISISVGYVWSAVFIASNLIRSFAFVALVGAVGNVSLNCLLIPRYGSESAAWLTLGTEFFVSTVLAVIYVRRTHFSIPWRSGLKILFAGGLMYPVLRAAMLVNLNFFIAVTVGWLTYIAALAVVRPIPWHIARDLLMRRVETLGVEPG